MSSPSRPTSKEFADHVRSVREKLHRAVDHLVDQHVTVEHFADEFDAILLGGHTEAWTLGRQRAGDLAELNHDDHVAGREMKDRESEWFQGFLDDLKGDRYRDDDGALREGPIKVRTDLYAQKLRGTANEAFVETGEDDDEYWWEDTGSEKECDDCPQIAAGSPYTKDTLYAYPCSGDTECLGNCECRLRRERKTDKGSESLYGFDAVDLDSEEEAD